ncbi:MAG: hypothetical protein CVV13_02930 [Gammaproteobacteria bacterium HGW-Gammaproteobacteria-3]|nr:MAG: hypothetical protein CVV13_02930 [Gammaproteobacteria bacterium HGW-Gammaproteobacteria-3]
MNKFIKGLSLLSLCVSCSMVWADKIGGGPRADFRDDTLTIPCVKVQNSPEAFNEQFFDIVLERRGKSFNYELTQAVSEDQELCQSIADFAAFKDDDFDGDDNDNGNDDDDSDDGSSTPRVRLSCESRTNRSKISVEAKNLDADGSYSAIVTSGDNTVESQPQTSDDDEVEFDFDSNTNDEGATLISADFIQDNTVTAQIKDTATGTVVLEADATCTTR